MKNGNLYKLAAFLMVFILLSAIGFAQTNKKEKEIKKKKTMMITMTVDEDGKTTKVDSIVFESPDVDMDEILKDIDIEMDITGEKMKEIHMQIEAEMDEAAKSFRFEFDEQSEELENAMEELQKELESLNLEEETQKRIQEAMNKLEEAGKHNSYRMERFFTDESHPIFFSKDGNIEVIVDENGDSIKTEVIWVDESDHVIKGGSKDVKVWVDSDGKEKVIIKSGGDVVEKENVFIIKSKDGDEKSVIIDIDSDTEMAMFSSSKEKDIENAIKAGLPIDKDKMIEELNIFVEIKDEQAPIIKLKTNSDSKLKATAYDKDFKKLKKVKVVEEDGYSIVKLDTDYIKNSDVAFLLLEQDGKTDLMRIHR